MAEVTHRRQQFGEIDFVIVNQSGDVLLIEQKNGPLGERFNDLVVRHASAAQSKSIIDQIHRSRSLFYERALGRDEKPLTACFNRPLTDSLQNRLGDREHVNNFHCHCNNWLEWYGMWMCSSSPLDGYTPTITTYKTPAEQIERLDDRVQALMPQGFDADQIATVGCELMVTDD